MLRKSAFIALVSALAASGCAQGGKIDPLAGGGGISGNWLPDGGGYTAVFDNGRFSTTATDTGNVISQGSYIAISGMEVELSWTSNITGLENSAKCQRPQADVLQCADAGGKTFTLRRT